MSRQGKVCTWVIESLRANTRWRLFAITMSYDALITYKRFEAQLRKRGWAFVGYVGKEDSNKYHRRAYWTFHAILCAPEKSLWNFLKRYRHERVGFYCKLANAEKEYTGRKRFKNNWKRRAKEWIAYVLKHRSKNRMTSQRLRFYFKEQ